jgi:hypothetical protein
VALLATGVRSLFVSVPWFSYYLSTPLLLGGGAAAAGYGLYIFRSTERRLKSDGRASDTIVWERGVYVVVTMLVILSLFLATSLYAAALGRGKSQELVGNLASRPSVVLYSKQALSMPNPVVESGLEALDSTYRFRYTGLRLLIRSAGKYFLVSDPWSSETGTTVVLDDTSDIRLEYKAGQP